MFSVFFSHPNSQRLVPIDPGFYGSLKNISLQDFDVENDIDLFHPFWESKSRWIPYSFLTFPDHINISSSLKYLEHYLGDPKSLIEAEFKASEQLKSRVLFWMLIHTQFSKRFRVIHDRNDLSIIYGFLDLSPLYRKYGITKLLESKISKLESNIIGYLKNTFLSCIDSSSSPHNSSNIPMEEKEKVRAFLSNIGALSRFKVLGLVNSMRTQTGQNDEFVMALYRSKLLLPHIESVFKQNNLPVALARIPFVESSFNDRAHSKAGALGIWQFMPGTAREMIHSSNRSLWIDPIYQTKAAARLFRNYRSVLPDWGTTITSYNSGVGRIRKMIQKHNISTINALLNIHHNDSNLGFAGTNFYAQFLSANYVEAYKDAFFNFKVSPDDVAKIIEGTLIPKEVCNINNR